MQAIRKVHALPYPAQRLRCGGSIFQTHARQPREIGESLGALGSGKPIAAAQHPLGLHQHGGADEGVIVVDQPACPGSLSGIVAHQVADDEISIDCEHAAVSPRRRSPPPYPRSTLPTPYRVGSQTRLSAGWAQRRASPSATRPRGYPPPPVRSRRASVAVHGSPWAISLGPWSRRWWSVSAWRTWRLYLGRRKKERPNSTGWQGCGNIPDDLYSDLSGSGTNRRGPMRCESGPADTKQTQIELE